MLSFAENLREMLLSENGGVGALWRFRAEQVEAYIVFKKAPINMSQAKLDAILQNRRVLPFSSKKNPDFLLRLQLQKEVDRLAVLLDEVKKQTERVQTAADAIGDAFLSDQAADTSAIPAQDDGPPPLKTIGGR